MEEEHKLMLAQVAEYLASLDHQDIDAIENYLSQVEMTEEIGDFYAQTNQFEDDDLATMAEYLS